MVGFIMKNDISLDYGGMQKYVAERTPEAFAEVVFKHELSQL